MNPLSWLTSIPTGKRREAKVPSPSFQNPNTPPPLTHSPISLSPHQPNKTHVHRYIRQDHHLWSRLHQGVLTTGNINAALGFYEPTSTVPHNKQLKLHRDRVGRHHILSVAQHLAQKEYIPQCNTIVTPDHANEHNSKVLYAYNNNIEAAALPPKTNQPSPHPPPTTTGTTGTTTGTANIPNSSIPEDFKLRKARSMQSLGLSHCRQTWGKVQEAASIYVLMKLFPDSVVSEIGMCRLDTNNIAELLKSWGFQDGDLPPLGASPDAMIEHYEDEDSSVLMKRLALKDKIGNNNNNKRKWKEIVEVKNTCPFFINRAGEYIISDRGPRSAVDPLWMPQLQLHMLCADTASGLLLSRSATMGVRVMRVHRDDEYLRLMLGCVKALYTRTREGKYYGNGTTGRDHKRLVEKTAELARKAEVVVDNDVNIHPVGGDDRLFI